MVTCLLGIGKALYLDHIIPETLQMIHTAAMSGGNKNLLKTGKTEKYDKINK